jgi:hypothetical protein
MLFTIGGQLSSFEKLYRESLSEASFDTSIVFSGTSLVIKDLTEWPASGWAVYYPSGMFSKKGEEYFKLINVLLARESSWTIAQAYEAFEKFLKDISATLFQENQALAEAKRVEKFESDKKSSNLTKTDISFWRGYIDYHYPTNAGKMKLLRKICPDILMAEKKNNRVVDLTEWFPVVKEVRDAATHSDFTIRASRMKNWSQSRRNMLKEFFSGVFVDQEYKLNTAIKDAEFCLQLFSEYSFQIYKFLSISRSYDWGILQRKNEE